MLLRFVFWLAIFFSIKTTGQSTAGSFRYKHFNVKDYHTHPLNFDAIQSADGLMYFANAYGVLQFDGTNWETIGLPNGLAALQLGLSENNEVLVGSYGEFGVLKTDSVGGLSYHSLIPKIPEKFRTKSAVLTFLTVDSLVYILTRDFIYVKKGEVITVVSNRNKQHAYVFLGQEDGQVFAIDTRSNKFDISDGKFEKTTLSEGISDALLKIINCGGKEILIGERSFYIASGKFVVPKKNDLPKSFNVKTIITSSVPINEHQILFGTNFDGLFLYDLLQDEITLINESNGLPSNTIYSIYLDADNTAWLSTDNGIIQLWMNSPFRFLNKDHGINGRCVATTFYHDSLYVGTSEGLFVIESINRSIQSNIKAKKILSYPVSHLVVVGDKLICTTTEGVFISSNTGLKLIQGQRNYEGNWKFSPLLGDENFAIKGTYEGFQLYEKINGTWFFKSKVNGFEESSRVFEQSPSGDVWVCHGNKGVFKMHFNRKSSSMENVINYNERQQLVPSFFVSVDLVQGRVAFSGNDGAYYFNDKVDSILPFEEINKVFGGERYINKIIETSKKRIWLFSGTDLMLLWAREKEEFSLIREPFSELNSKFNGSYEHLSFMQGNNYLVGVNDGIVICNLSAFQSKRVPFKPIVREISYLLKEDSVIQQHNFALSDSLVLPYGFKNLQLEFIIPSYSAVKDTYYKYKLTPLGEKTAWSNWSKATTLYFSGIAPGEYLLTIKGKVGSSGAETIGTTVKLEVVSPWFMSFWAYLVYLLIFVLLLYLLVLYVKYLLAKQQKRLELKRVFENAESEKKMLALQKEKLESEMKLKNHELASIANAVKQKDDILINIKKEVKSIKFSEPIAKSEFQLQKVLSTIDSSLNFDDSWEVFQKNFDLVYNNFIHDLREQYPRLNTSWLMFCAYIRMNKTNKEIAELMNMTVGAVEKRKYRMHEKFNMKSYQELLDYFFKGA